MSYSVIDGLVPISKYGSLNRHHGWSSVPCIPYCGKSSC